MSDRHRRLKLVAVALVALAMVAGGAAAVGHASLDALHRLLLGSIAAVLLGLVPTCVAGAADPDAAVGASLGVTVSLFGFAIVRLAAFALSPTLRADLGPVLVAEVFVLTALGAWAATCRPDARGLTETVRGMGAWMTRFRGAIRWEFPIALPLLFLAPMAFADSVAGQVWLLAGFPNTGIALAVMAVAGPSRLVGLGHLVPWGVPMVATWRALPSAEGLEAAWLASALIAGAVVLAIDVAVLWPWWSGDRDLPLAPARA